jgi:hypothetical protein
VPRARVRTMPRLTERQQLAAAMAASAADYEHERGTAVKTTTMKTTTTTTTTHGEHMGVGRGYSPVMRTPHAVNEHGSGVGARHGASAGTPRTPASAGAGAGATTPATTMVTTPGESNLYGALQSNKRNRSRQAKELASLAPWAWDPLVGKHAPGPSALRDFSEVVTDKTLVASASGAISSVAVKTFTRFPIDDVVVGDAKGRAAAVKQTTGKDAAQVGAADVAAKAKKPAAATTTTTTVAAVKTPVTTTTKARDGKKRARITMGAVTPLKLASTLDEASEREKPTAGTRSSARATAAAAARAVAVQVSNKENAVPKQKRAPLPPPSRAPSRAALTEVKNAPAAPKRKAVENPTAKAVVAVATAVAPKTKDEKNLMFITPVAPAKKKSRIGATSDDDVRRQWYAFECLLAKTYVKAIRHPIMPAVKPSRRLLEAYRAFSKSRITPNERVSAPTTELKIGAALERGLDALVAEDARFAK